MKVLCTFPGRFGDIIWALPTIRALSRKLDQPVDFMIAGEFYTLEALLAQQPYLGRVFVNDKWAMHPPNEWQPPSMEEDYDLIFDLGYRGWPSRALIHETLFTYNTSCHGAPPLLEEELDLTTPWITLPETSIPGPDLVIAFSETHFELKLGLTMLVLEQYSRHDPDMTYRICTVRGSRWKTDLWDWPSVRPGTWSDYASYLQHAQVALCCNSGAHVLAVAMGVPVVMYEPMEARHNPIFFPLGCAGPQVTLVMGNDGKPTTDARHTLDTIAAVRARVVQEQRQ